MNRIFIALILSLSLTACKPPTGYAVVIGAVIGMSAEVAPWWKALPSTPRCLKCGEQRKLWPHGTLTPRGYPQNAL